MESNEKQRAALIVTVIAFMLGSGVGFGLCWFFLVRGQSPMIDIGASAPGGNARYSGTFTSVQAAPPPGTLTAFRNRVGKSMLFKVTGTTGATIWGNEIYTDDSPLPVTAVHAGALRSGEEGILRVTFLPGQESYTGTIANGVTSSSYAKWDGSYKLERVNGPTTEPVIELPAGGGATATITFSPTTNRL